VGVGRSDRVGFLSSAACLGTMVSLPHFRPVVASSTAPGRVVVYRRTRLRRFHSGFSGGPAHHRRDRGDTLPACDIVRRASQGFSSQHGATDRRRGNSMCTRRTLGGGDSEGPRRNSAGLWNGPPRAALPHGRAVSVRHGRHPQTQGAGRVALDGAGHRPSASIDRSVAPGDSRDPVTSPMIRFS